MTGTERRGEKMDGIGGVGSGVERRSVEMSGAERREKEKREYEGSRED